jgi:AcrR family transcriptional regulator
MRRRRRTVRAALSLDRILAESSRAFSRRGYYGTTLDEIADALGVTKAALYYHVKSKEELLFLCHQRSLDIGMDGFRHAQAQSTRPDEQLRIIVEHYIRGMTTELTGNAILLEEEALAPRHLRRIIARRDEYERNLRRVVQDGIDAGVFVACDAKLVAFAILGAVNWIPKWYRASGPRSGKEIAEAFASYLVRGLLTSPPDVSLPPAG